MRSEISRCKEPIGKQDQYAAAFGGLNLIRFHPDESVSVDPVICKREILQQLEDSVLVFFTGRTRSASAVLAEQSRQMRSLERKSLARQMVKLAFDMKDELESGSLDAFGEILQANWELKRQLSQGISDSQIDEWYATGIANGARGGKLLGAGNGGFLMFYAHPETHQRIASTLGLQQVRFRFDRNGAQIVFFQPQE